MIKAIFLDIDGTLVSFKSHKIPFSAIEALQRVKARGVKIFISTGRPWAFINNLTQLQDLDLIDGYITMNGSYCFVGDEVIYSNPIPRDEARAIAEFCEAGGHSCVFVGAERTAIRNSTELFTSIFYDMLHVDEIPTAETLEEALSFETYQLSPFVHRNDEAPIVAVAQNCEIGRWMDDFADIGAKGNTKARGIDAIINHFGISLSETMAIGDGGNDIAMLRHAGIGVAMGNASDEVKAAANYVTSHIDEDGLARAVSEFLILNS